MYRHLSVLAPSLTSCVYRSVGTSVENCKTWVEHIKGSSLCSLGGGVFYGTGYYGGGGLGLVLAIVLILVLLGKL